MGYWWRFLIAAIMGLASACEAGWAQPVPPSAIAVQIRELELQVKKQSGQGNGETLWKLAMLYQDAARYEDAEHAYEKAIELLRTGNRTTLANAEDCMGTMYVETGRYAQAEPLEREALAIRNAENDSVGLGRSWMHLAMLSMGKHELADSAKYAELATERLVPERRGRPAQDGATPEEKMTALTYLALARCAQGACAAALPELKRALDLAQTSYKADSFPVAYLDFLLGYAYWKSGDDRMAADLMKSGAAGIEAQLGWGHPTYISLMTQYQAFLAQTGRSAEAAEVRAKIAHLRASRGLPNLASGDTALGISSLP